jgi:hypothetical protein
MFYDWSSKGSTYSAVVPLTNLFGLYQIPEPDQLMFPINLVLFQWRLTFSIRNLKLRYLLLDLKNLTQKSGLVRTQRTEHGDQTDPGWSGWRWRRDPGPQTSDSRLTIRSKERKIITHPIVIFYHRSSLYIGIGNWLYSNIFNVITDSLPFVNYTYRKPANLL